MFFRYLSKYFNLKFTLIFLFLFFSQNLLAQNYYLEIKSENMEENRMIDSLKCIKKHLNTKSVVNEINDFSSKVLQLGFLESKNEIPKKTNDSTFVMKVNLGKRNKFIHIYLGKNLEYLSLKKDTLKMLISETENFMKNNLLQLEKKGFSLAKLQLINFRKAKGELYADLNLDSEKIRTLDDIVINGYEKFPAGHKKQIKRLYRNKVFNQENLKKIYSDFSKFRFTNQIKYPEILFTKDSTKVYVYLEKAKPNTFDGFIGFNNDEQKKLIVNGYLDLQLQNIINGGEKISLYWKSDGKKQKTFNGALEIPYVFKSQIGIKAQLNIFKQDSLYQNTETALDLGYYFNYNTKLYLGYQSAESSDIQNTNSATLSDFNNSFFTTQFDFTIFNPDDFLFPDKTKILFKVGTGKRELATKSDSQFFTTLNINHNFYLNKKNIINIKSSNYYLNSSNFVLNELYRFGGINSIRGFNENSLQGNFFTSILSEYRYVVNPNTYLHSIIDYGYYQDKTSNSTNSLVGLGFGFGLVTKNGLFNLVYANGSTKEQDIKLSNSIVHISFKARF